MTKGDAETAGKKIRHSILTSSIPVLLKQKLFLNCSNFLSFRRERQRGQHTLKRDRKGLSSRVSVLPCNDGVDRRLKTGNRTTFSQKKLKM